MRGVACCRARCQVRVVVVGAVRRRAQRCIATTPGVEPGEHGRCGYSGDRVGDDEPELRPRQSVSAYAVLQLQPCGDDGPTDRDDQDAGSGCDSPELDEAVDAQLSGVVVNDPRLAGRPGGAAERPDPVTRTIPR
jgi:hypothetical protein